MSFRLDGKVAVITSAAQGIGAASARIMAELGATVVLGDINEAGAKETAEKINAAGGKACGVKFDARDKESVRALIHDAQKTYGRLDILHNNAGGTYPARDKQAADLDDDLWREVFAWNIDCAHWATQAALPLMIEGGGGAIVNTVTGGAMFAQSTQTAYGTSKGALASYTRYVAVQYGWRNVRCNGIAPGLIVTPHAWAVMTPVFREEICKHITTPRVGVPDDIGYAAAFLASDAAGYINGQIIHVDGNGFRCPHDADVLAAGGYGPGHPKPPRLPMVPEGGVS